MDRRISLHTWYAVFVIFAVLMLQAWLGQANHQEAVPFSEFISALENGELSDVEISGQVIRGTRVSGTADLPQHIVATIVEPALAQTLSQYDVTYSARAQSGIANALVSWFLPMVFFLAVWMLFIRRIANHGGMGGNAVSIGQSKAKVYVEADTRVTFADVAGVEEAKAELKEIVAFLKDPQGYGRLGARMPKGILLVGPPGTGKTLFARAMAGEASVPFFSISGSEFVEMFVGVGAARVRDLFEKAREKAPAIIFIDELDALGRARGAYPGLGGHDEKEQTLNQLLSELDGFDPSRGLVLLAATNRPEVLDPALLRAGRFDRQVLVDRPDKSGRIAILQVHTHRIEIEDDTDLDEIAALTPGFSGADLANLVNEAALLATRRDAQAVSLIDFVAAIERIVAGLEKKNRLLNPIERKTVAYHELGHALVAMALKNTDPVQKVSIIPRGIGSLGYTIQRPTEDRFLMSKAELEAKMAVLLAGRAAEQMVFDEVSTGAADDLQKASQIARAMATRYGMVEDIGQVALEKEDHAFLGTRTEGQISHYSEATAQKIDDAVQAAIAHAFERATQILSSHREALDDAALILLEKETLTGQELARITGALTWKSA
ncbi:MULTISPECIES: ATP-dependent zinc metalloprotease FtsH [Maricaulis]|jgi:cell division protease FtsH|uniref:ATP-dependent zinc metalloprotease FtsH n=1 Tax=Maricaulis maris (strain MCS10) TaxID=394221 RepID=Q0AT98_MARMM|nr:MULTISPECIES: ATP-dependent zinc metalloprotease FtsH [Maricaulis]ABI64489.1 membrane protease FtsH catalytic subunit [Maricaulis maris MCS10]MAC88659.1 cell division protein FtsH [Maricaulis sp.]